MGRGLNLDIKPKEIKMVTRCMKRCSVSVISRKMKVKSTMSVTTHLLRVLLLKRQKVKSVDKDAEKDLGICY